MTRARAARQNSILVEGCVAGTHRAAASSGRTARTHGAVWPARSTLPDLQRRGPSKAAQRGKHDNPPGARVLEALARRAIISARRRGTSIPNRQHSAADVDLLPRLGFIREL